jgi:hypothetical protein
MGQCPIKASGWILCCGIAPGRLQTFSFKTFCRSYRSRISRTFSLHGEASLSAMLGPIEPHEDCLKS